MPLKFLKYLCNEDITRIDNPPYSSDLAACDFLIFSKLKQSLDISVDFQSLES